MPEKLKLSLDDLRVETFDTTGGPESAAGTVHALDCYDDTGLCAGCSRCTDCTDCTGCSGCSVCSTQSYQVETGCFHTCYDFVSGGPICQPVSTY